MTHGLESAIKALHARKTRAYGTAWKRRGERISILPNIARKVDRLAVFARDQSTLSDESALDTAIDLYVYCLKYRLYLAEHYPAALATLPLDAPISPLSDSNDNFNQLVHLPSSSAESAIAGTIQKIEDLFERLWPMAEMQNQSEARFDIARELSDAASRLIQEVASKDPHAVTVFVKAELSSTDTQE